MKGAGFGGDRDVSMINRASSPGMTITRRCFRCNAARTKGVTEPRTRMWYCLACAEKTIPAAEAVK